MIKPTLSICENEGADQLRKTMVVLSQQKHAHVLDRFFLSVKIEKIQQIFFLTFLLKT